MPWSGTSAWSSSSRTGRSWTSRLQDADAKVLITAAGTPRRGKVVPMKETADAAMAQAATVRSCIVWPRLGRRDLSWVGGRDLRWEEAVDGQLNRFETQPLDP